PVRTGPPRGPAACAPPVAGTAGRASRPAVPATQRPLFPVGGPTATTEGLPAVPGGPSRVDPLAARRRPEPVIRGPRQRGPRKEVVPRVTAVAGVPVFPVAAN